MNKTIKDTIHANGIDIGIYTTDFENDYISLTDIARYRSSDPRITIHTWLRGRDIVEFLGLWESLHNPDFKRSEFDTFKKDAGTNAFTFSIKNYKAKELLQNLVAMAVEFLHIQTLHWNLHHGFLLSSNFIS